MMMNIGIRPAFEEHVEQHHIERAEHADHQRLEDQEGDHVFLDALLHRLPARQDAQRHQEGRQDDEQHRNAVDAHVVAMPPPSQADFSTNWKPASELSK
jgi:hypothetical protein